MGALVQVVSLLLVLGVLYWAVSGAVAEIRHRRRRRATRDTSDARGQPERPAHQRVTDEALEARAQELRQALQQDLITMDEAVDSLVRIGGSAVDRDRAERLLR